MLSNFIMMNMRLAVVAWRRPNDFMSCIYASHTYKQLMYVYLRSFIVRAETTTTTVTIAFRMFFIFVFSVTKLKGNGNKQMDDECRGVGWHTCIVHADIPHRTASHRTYTHAMIYPSISIVWKSLCLAGNRVDVEAKSKNGCSPPAIQIGTIDRQRRMSAGSSVAQLLCVGLNKTWKSFSLN